MDLQRDKANCSAGQLVLRAGVHRRIARKPISTPLHHYLDEMEQTETSNRHLRLAGNAMGVK